MCGQQAAGQRVDSRRLRKLSLQGSKKEKQGPEKEMLNKNKTSQTRLDRKVGFRLKNSINCHPPPKKR